MCWRLPKEMPSLGLSDCSSMLFSPGKMCVNRNACLQVPLQVAYNCRNPAPLNGIASKSASAQQYVRDLRYILGDGWTPVSQNTPKGQHNESWALGLSWNSNCIESKENVPECEMLFDAGFRATGGAQIKRVPAGGTVKFNSCSVLFDTTFLNSSTCFQVPHSLSRMLHILMPARHHCPPLHAEQFSGKVPQAV